MELPIVNHPDYVAKINDDNKFPIKKFGELANHLKEKKIAKNFFVPKPCSIETLNQAHSKDYISNIQKKTLDQLSQKKIGFPLNDSVVQRSFVATGGTVLASKLAISYGLACNTAGGSHHASFNEGAGFCVFNDVAVAIRLLARDSKIQNALVVDFDVHQGDGTAAFFRTEPEFYTFSLHCQENYPLKKQVSDLDIGVPTGTGDSIYLSVVQTHVQPLIKKLKPDIVFYNAGVDPHENDKLGKLKLTDAGLRARDDHVIETCLMEGVPLACVVGGGYDNDLDTLARRHGTLHRAAVSALQKLS